MSDTNKVTLGRPGIGRRPHDMTTLQGWIIFTGANYWMVPELPKSDKDFVMASGLRWIKSRKQFSQRWQMFACPNNYRTLTPVEAKAQGLVVSEE